MTSQSANPKAVFSSKEAADYLGMSKSALDKSRLTGELFGTAPPAFLRFGRAVRYPKAALDNWLVDQPTYKTVAEQNA